MHIESQNLTSCFAEGDMDSLLDSATLDSNEPSPLSSSQESTEEKSVKNTHSPKDSHSPKDRVLPPKETCSGETDDTNTTKRTTVLFFFF